ncbi:DUF2630 family protein [Streptomyces wedmorensis]|uniref:DUF2630 family protein n=1 Tax=Streptomyces wedmorensis TaxID=43759 RepID=UPI0005240C52
MDNEEILDDIGALVEEERALRQRTGGLLPEERARLAELEVRLDQCWDLLRQRRAKSTPSAPRCRHPFRRGAPHPHAVAGNRSAGAVPTRPAPAGRLPTRRWAEGGAHAAAGAGPDGERSGGAGVSGLAGPG